MKQLKAKTNNMRLRYIASGQNKVADFTNHDVKFRLKVEDYRMTLSLEAKVDMELVSASEVVPFKANYKDRYFFNGYQSWTDSCEYPLAKRLRNIKKSPHIITKKFALDKYGDSSFYQYSIRKSHGYDLFYARGKSEIFIYSLNYKVAYLIMEVIKDSRHLKLTSDIRGIKLKAGESLTIFDFKLFYNYEEGLAAFQKDFPLLHKEKLFGYTSWYNYYQAITEDIILRDLDALDSRFKVFQIDDGYETFVGDWLDVDAKKFPHELESVVKKIKEKGMIPGIWLAPFVAERNSKLFKEHPEYFVKDSKGRPVQAGGNWSGQFALDFQKEEVRDYIKKCLTHYMELGFEFFKLDFLYAVALLPFEGKSRCQSQNEAYQFLREVLKGKLILGCGANIFNSYEAFDYLRVGPDVSLNFDDSFVMRLFHRERVSTKVTLQNTIYRSVFNDRLFGNDPDVFLLRDENIQLSKQQRRALTLINALFGTVLLTSDNIATYDEEKQATLKEAFDLFEKAENLAHSSSNQIITISYTLDGVAHEKAYDTKKGVFVYER